MTHHVVIITGKRVICVDEVRGSSLRKQNAKLTAEGEQQRSNQGGLDKPETKFVDEEAMVKNMGSGVSYKHWNVFFKDIYKVTIDVFDRETDKKISLNDLAQS